MASDCGCPGGCGNSAEWRPALNRREFLKVSGLAAAGASLPGSLVPAVAADRAPDLESWKASLLSDVQPRLYRSDRHTDARMHLGGIGTGNITLGPDGRFTGWNLFNTLAEGDIPFHFGIFAGGKARLLQTSGGPDVDRVPLMTMRGDYPVLELEIHDPSLPVAARLQAMTPMVPLDEWASSMPVLHLQFEIRNPTDVPQAVSLAGMMLNPVGYEGRGDLLSGRHSSLGGNVNRLARRGGLHMLEMAAVPAAAEPLGTPVTVYTNRAAGALSGDLPHGLSIRPLRDLPSGGSSPLSDHVVIWLDSPDFGLTEDELIAAGREVDRGAAILVSGGRTGLLTAYASWCARGGPSTAASESERGAAARRRDIVLSDFESGTYRGWTVEGSAFGKRPSRGTEPNQQSVSGFEGRYLVNSYPGSDEPQGRLLSDPFKIERRYLRFLVGGGSSPDTAVRLLVDNKVVRSTSGKDREELEPGFWDLSDLQDREARIEIIDRASGGWGHINVDFLVMSDDPANERLLKLFYGVMPVSFTSLQDDPRPISFETGGGSETVLLPPILSMPASLAPGGLAPLTGAVIVRDASGRPGVAYREMGRGRQIFISGPMESLTSDQTPSARWKAAALLASLGGVPVKQARGQLTDSPGFGDYALAVDGGEVSALLDGTTMAAVWDSWKNNGRFPSHGRRSSSGASADGASWFGGLSSSTTIPAHSSTNITFVLSWRLPNLFDAAGERVGNYYSTLWSSAADAAAEVYRDPHSVVSRTLRFRETMYDSTLPYWLLDCLTSQMSTIRHIGVVFRTGDGGIYGWEGSNGCCQPTCTHVWGYEQSLSRLYPSLERRMRLIDYRHQQDASGGIHNRTVWPSPPHPTGEQPFADGHASCILKAYREALNTHDGRWLHEYWPAIRAAVEYLVRRDAAGGSPDGILEDAQFNTYDGAVHGANSFIGGYYLAALRAGEEMARRVGDSTAAARYREIFESGQRRLVERCWNGDYFQQDLPDYQQRAGEYGPGCMADQLIGQWWAHLLGLGYILPQAMVRRSLQSIYDHNWLPDMTGFRHHQRAFAGGSDRGLLICSWPRGGRPAQPILYVDEVWTGVEYEVAALMAYEGMIEEGLAIARGARDRYDGVPRPPIPRSPWNEIECGGHYARAMSSWSLLHALTGFRYDGMERRLRFAPPLSQERFRAFFTAPQAWGSLTRETSAGSQVVSADVVEGFLPLQYIELDLRLENPTVQVLVDGRNVPAAVLALAGAARGEAEGAAGGTRERSAGEPGIMVVKLGSPVVVRRTLVVRCQEARGAGREGVV